MSFETISIYNKADNLLRSTEPTCVNEALALLSGETEARPQHAKAWFELAGAYDSLGRESEALALYEKVRVLGYERLPIEDQSRLFIQLGSTLRNLKRYEEARKVLLDGISKFPKVAALKAFLALTEYSDGRYRKAAQIFAWASLHCVEDTSLQDYSRALHNYYEEIDTFPAHQRNWMRLHLCQISDPLDDLRTSPVNLEHAIPLATLMEAAYRNTIDQEDRIVDLDQCLHEIRNTIEGADGPLISDASFIAWEGSMAISASIVTYWRNKPLLAFSMTSPSHQRQGLAGCLIQKSAFALKSAGYAEFYLVVTEGNTPAEALYRKLGFETLGPFLPASGITSTAKQ